MSERKMGTVTFSERIAIIMEAQKDIEIRQLVFNMHKIFYYIEKDKIIIVRIIYSARNLDNIIKEINKFID